MKLDFDSLLKYLQNPYVIGVLSILTVVYGGFLAPKLPPNIASWFANPIFKVLFIFLILAVRHINPTISILLALGLVISIQTLNRYRIFTMANEVSQMTSNPGVLDSEIKYTPPEELNQFNQEISNEIASDQTSTPVNLNNKITQQDINSIQPSSTDLQTMTNQNAPEKELLNNDFLIDDPSKYHQNKSESQNQIAINQNISDMQNQFGTNQNSFDMMIPTEITNKNMGPHENSDFNNYHDFSFNTPDPLHPIVEISQDAVHPMNKSSPETWISNQRIEDPNATNHPGWKMFGNNNIDIYELNPPFYSKNLPNQFTNPLNKYIEVNSSSTPIFSNQNFDSIQSNQVSPTQTATRYSAFHAYPK